VIATIGPITRTELKFQEKLTTSEAMNQAIFGAAILGESSHGAG